MSATLRRSSPTRLVIGEAAINCADAESADEMERRISAVIADAIRAAVEEEREACASVAECWDLGTFEGFQIAAEIRRRKP